MADPPSEQHPIAGLCLEYADLPIDQTSCSLDDVRGAVAKLKGKKTVGASDISAELHQDRRAALTRGLDVVCRAVG